jgi:uncharacterized protein (DUF58 family)
MTPTRRSALVLAGIALLALLLPFGLVLLLAVAWLGATIADAVSVRRPPIVTRRVSPVLARGVDASLTADVEPGRVGKWRVRQPVPPDLVLDPSEADGALHAVLHPRRRGRHPLAPLATRSVGPLGLGAWHHRAGDQAEVTVYPDVFAARRIAVAVQRGRFAEQGHLPRGPLGLGTQFEQIREYQPDDDIRQVNWRATARLGRPMSNQYRVEQDRDVICVVDGGRLMAAPLGDRTRLDAAIDAAVAVALVADVVGDRCGTVAFAGELRRRVPPRRAGGEAVVHALFDLEPEPVDSDYELAFHTVGGGKRALVIVFTDLLEPAAARPLVEAIPVLARRHAVVVAGATDPDLDALARTEPVVAHDAYAMAVALDVLDARARVAAQLRAAGADVVEAAPDALGAACVAAYLRAKARARL